MGIDNLKAVEKRFVYSLLKEFGHDVCWKSTEKINPTCKICGFTFFCWWGSVDGFLPSAAWKRFPRAFKPQVWILHVRDWPSSRQYTKQHTEITKCSINKMKKALE